MYDGMGAAPHQREQYYGLTLDFNQTIAAAGNGVVNAKTDGDWPFVIESLTVGLYVPAVAGTSLIYGPWLSIADTTAANRNNFPSYFSARLQLLINDVTLWRTPIRCGNLVEGVNGRHILKTPVRVPKGVTVQGTLYNDSAANDLQAQILLEGFYQR